jgi:hypothetical protein
LSISGDEYLAWKSVTVKKVVKYVLYVIGAILLALLVFGIAVIIPIDRTPYQEKEYYPLMMSRLDSVNSIPVPKAATGFKVGYGIGNLTPDAKLATAGYGNRRGKDFTSVHDSIYVRAMVIDNGTTKVAVVTADLLIMPPTVTELLETGERG